MGKRVCGSVQAKIMPTTTVGSNFLVRRGGVQNSESVPFCTTATPIFADMNKPVLLVILDGWGLGTNPAVSAIAAAKTPFVDSLFQRFPTSRLQASGEAVGLPDGQMGNSEVGHMNLGAGRVVYRDLVRINKAVRDRKLASMPALKQAFEYLRQNPDKNLHLMGLLSDGGVHSHIDHLKALCTIAHDEDVHRVMAGRPA